MDIKIAIVEDDAVICEELTHILAEVPDFACVAVCRNFKTAIRQIPLHRPDVILMDIHLPDGSGIECTARLKRLLPEAQIMVFTVHEDSAQIHEALEAGASGYLLKRTRPEELIRAIREIKQGGVPMTGEVARKVIQTFRRKAGGTGVHEVLSRREEEVLELLAKGRLSKEIAERLSISVDTVNSHLKHIYDKLHVRSRTEAVIKYIG